MFHAASNHPAVMLRPQDEIYVPIKYTPSYLQLPPWSIQPSSCATGISALRATNSLPPLHEKVSRRCLYSFSLFKNMLTLVIL